MASNIFTATPSSGNGNGTVSIVPQNPNSDNYTKESRVIVICGNISREVNVYQYGIPTMTLVSGNPMEVPATGGVYSFTIYSPYPFGFGTIPSWMDVSDSNGHTYESDTAYTAAMATGATFYVTVNSNPDTTVRSHNLIFKFRKIGSNYWDTHTTRIPFNQYGKEEEQTYLNVSPASASFDWTTSGQNSVVFTIDASNSNWEFVNGSNGIFNAVRSGNTLTVSTISNNTTTAQKTGNITFTLGTITKSVSLTQYRQPIIDYNSGSDLSPVPAAGGNKYVKVLSDYPFWFRPQPNADGYITAYYQGNEVDPSYINPFIPSGGYNVFTFTWDENETGVLRSDSFSLGWINLDGELDYHKYQHISFEQRADTEPVHNVSISDRLSVSSIGGVRKVTVTSDDDWWFINVPNWITVYSDAELTSPMVVNDPAGQQDADGGNPHTFYFVFEPFDGTGATTRTYRPEIDYDTDTASSITQFTQYDDIIEPNVNKGDYEVPYYNTVKEVMVDCDYDWYWYSVPNYVTILDEDGNPASYSSSSPNTTDKGTGSHIYYWVFDENTGSGRSCEVKIEYGTYEESDFDVLGNKSDGIYYQYGPYEINPTSGSNAMPDATQAYFTFSLATAPWTYTAPSWITVNADTDSHFGSVRLSIAQNSGISRTGSVVITSGSHTLTYTFEQGGSIALGPDPNAFYLTAMDAINHTVTVRMLYSWNHTVNDSWIHIADYDHSAGTGTLVFYVDDNTGTGAAERYGSITVYDSENSYNISIEQDADETEDEDTFEVSPTTVNVHYANYSGNPSYQPAEQTITATITIDSGYSVLESDSWIHIIAGGSSGSGGTHTLYFYVEKNPNTTSRNGTITITRTSDDEEKTISINQMAGSFTATQSGTRYTYKASGEKTGSATLPTYVSYCAFSLRKSDGSLPPLDSNTGSPWVSANGSAGTGTISFTVQSNSSANSREVTLYPFKYENGSYVKLANMSWTIYQAGGSA